MNGSYWDSLKKIMIVSEKYKNLELNEFIRMTLLECGFDETIMNNVYINEDVNFPDTFGCYKDGNKIIAYFNNSLGEKRIKKYDNYAEFMLMFVRTACMCSKYEINSKKL